MKIADTVTFWLPLPEGWEELDIRPATRDRSLSLFVQDRLRDVPRLRPHRADLVAYLRNLARSAWDNGARFCGMFVVGDEEGLVPGSVTVSILPEAPSRGAGALDSIVDELQTVEDTTGEGAWWQTTMVDIPAAGRGVRSYGVRPVEVPDRTTAVPMVLMHTYIPFDGGVVLVACGSPAVHAAEPLLELFDVVTERFRFQVGEPDR
jgi:hypothetical protein